MAETGTLCVLAAQHVYDRFGKKVPAELLLEWYEGPTERLDRRHPYLDGAGHWPAQVRPL